MKKILVLSGLLLVAAFSCEKGDSINHELLAGDWTMEDSPYQFFTPTVSFTSSGRYTQTSITTFAPFQSLTYVEYSVTGDYVFRDGRITFNTASVSLSDDTDDNLYPYGYVTQPGTSIGQWWSVTSTGRAGDGPVPASEYNPVEWRVLELSDHTLRVSQMPDSVMVFTR